MHNVLRFPLERTRPTTGGLQVHHLPTAQTLQHLRAIAADLGSWAHDCPANGPMLIPLGEECIACGQRHGSQPTPPGAA